MTGDDRSHAAEARSDVTMDGGTNATGDDPPDATADGGEQLAGLARQVDRWIDRLDPRLQRWAWLAPGLLAGLCVYGSYLATHEYPAFGAGLFLYMAEEVVGHFPRLPERIPHYTADGVPFAYPPLAFLVVGVVESIPGVDHVALTRHGPHLVSLVALVPLYLVAESVLDSRPQAGLAAVLAATSPPLLQWHVSAGGIVRAPAYLFAVAGVYVGLRLFRDGGRRWLVLSAVCSGLTVLTHPMYAAFLATSYVALFATFDRTLAGLRKGVVVAAGGAVLSSPWWGQVVLVHGPGAITRATGTHGGLWRAFQAASELVTASAGLTHVLFTLTGGPIGFTVGWLSVLGGWFLLFVLAGAALLSDDGAKRFLPVWFLLTVLVLPMSRFLFLIGSLMLPPVLAWGSRWLRRGPVGRPARSDLLATGLVVLVAVAATATGALYAGSHLDTHAGSASQPTFVDEEDREAMAWVQAHTDADAEFVVLGDAAEWFPYESRRTILVGPWGVEWEGNDAYTEQITRLVQVSTCEDADCLTEALAAYDLRPDYVYVPKGEYTVRGNEFTAPPELHGSLERSGRYDLVYENDGVAVYEVDRAVAGGAQRVGPSAPSTRSESARTEA